jgi:hypothetical protein
LFKDTPLEDVLAILESGAFVAATDQKVGKGEKVIGEMTELEKALWSAAKKAAIDNCAECPAKIACMSGQEGLGLLGLLASLR